MHTLNLSNLTNIADNSHIYSYFIFICLHKPDCHSFFASSFQLYLPSVPTGIRKFHFIYVQVWLSYIVLNVYVCVEENVNLILNIGKLL